MTIYSNNQLASISLRIWSGLFDYIIIFGFILIVVRLKTNEIDGTITIENPIPIILFWLFMTVITEWFLGGTLGKYVIGLRVISLKTGKKASFAQSFVRHLFDLIDMLFFGLVGIMYIKFSSKNQRMGDLIASTIVVNTNKNVSQNT